MIVYLPEYDQHHQVPYLDTTEYVIPYKIYIRFASFSVERFIPPLRCVALVSHIDRLDRSPFDRAGQWLTQSVAIAPSSKTNQQILIAAVNCLYPLHTLLPKRIQWVSVTQHSVFLGRT